MQVLLAEAIFFGKRATRKVVAAIVVVCCGVGLSTVTDTQMGSNMVGWAVGGGAVLSTALYQIWAGSKQKELGAGSMQVSAAPAGRHCSALGFGKPDICVPAWHGLDSLLLILR